MGNSEDIERIKQLEEENEELRNQMDDIVDDICNSFDRIGRIVSENECKNCIETAKMLFRMIRAYGDDNAQVNALERFAHAYLTDESLNE